MLVQLAKQLALSTCLAFLLARPAVCQEEKPETPEPAAKAVAAVKEHYTFAPRAAWQLKRCFSPALSPQKDTLAYVNEKKDVVIRDLRTGDIQRTIPLDVKDGDFSWLTYLDNGATLLLSFTNGELQFWDVAKGQRTKKLDVIGESESMRWQSTFDGDQQLLTISGSYDEKATFAVHNLKTGAKGKTFQRPTQVYNGRFAVAGDGKQVAVTQNDKHIAVMQVDSPGKPRLLDASEHDVMDFVFSEDGKQLITATAGRDGLFRVWNLASGKVVKEQKADLSNLNALSLTPDSRLLIAYGSAQCLFDPATLEPRGSFPEGLRSHWLTFSADGSLIAALDQEYTNIAFLRLFDVAKPPPSVIQRRIVDDELALSATGKFIAVADDKGWSIVDTATWQEQFRIPERYMQFAFAPDADVVAWIKDESIHFRDLENKKDLPALARGSFYVSDLLFTDDGKHVFGPTDDGIVMWNRSSGKLVYGLRGASSKGYGPLAISPDGKWLAFTGEGGVVEIWDMAARARTNKFVAHDFAVNQLAFSRDSRALATAGDTTVRLWSAATGKLVHELGLIASECRSLWFPENGTSLLTVDSGGLVNHWDWRKAQLLDVIPTAIPDVEKAYLAPGGANLLTRHKQEPDETGYLQFWKTSDLLKPAAYQQSPVVKQKLEFYRGETNRMLPILAKIPPGNSYEVMELPDLVASAWSPTQPHFLLGRRDGSLTLYDAETASIIRQLPRAPGGLRGMAFTADGRDLLTASGATLQRVKVQDGTVVWSMKNDRPFKTAVFAPNRQQIVTYAQDDKTGQIKIWDAASGKELQKKEKESYLVPQVDGVTDGGLLLVGNYSPGWMKLTDMQQTSSKTSVAALQAQPKGEQLVALTHGDLDKRVVLIDPARNAVVAEIPTEFAGAYHVAFAPDGQRAYLHSGNSGLAGIDLQAKKELFFINGGPGMMQASVSADGRFLLGHSESDQAYLFDLQPLSDPAQAHRLSEFGSHNTEECRYLPAIPGVAFRPLHLTRRVYGRDNYLALAKLPQLTNLASLDLDGPPLDDLVAAQLGQCRELRRLRLVNSNYLTATGVTSLAQLTNLEELELGAHSLDDAALAPLAKLPKLRKLTVRGEKLGAVGALELAKFPALTEIGWNGKNIDAEIGTALAKIPQLTTLEVIEGDLEPGALAPLAAANKLRRLKFFQTEIDGADVLSVKQLTALEFLNSEITSLDQLTHLPQLTELSVRECPVDYTHFAALKRAGQLQKFDFAFGYSENFAGLENLAGLPGPKQLRLPSNLKPAETAGIAGWTTIEELTLTGDHTDETLTHLAGLKNLRVLKFNEYSEGPFTGSGLAHLATCPLLTDLDLKGQKLTSAGIAGLAGLTQLTSLTLPRVDDTSVVHLAKLTKLTRLKLQQDDGQKLTSAAADTLLKLTELTHLDLGNTDLKAAGIEKLTALKKLESLRLPFSLPYNEREELQKKLGQLLPNTYVH